MKAVTALIGRFPSNPGILATRLHKRLTVIPISITAGVRILWSLVLKMNLARCGMASPKNAIGPQYAVTIAVKYPEMRMMNKLFLFMLIPRFSAYKSPNSMIFRFFDMNKLAKSPMMMLVEKNISLLVPTAEKDPIPHITKAWMSSFMLKNFIMSVREPAKYDIIKPMIISVVMFLTRLLKPSISIKTNVAPTKAARVTPRLDHIPIVESAEPPKIPVSNMVIATPKPAPLLIPSIEGSASGFLNRVCIKRPEMESAAPANMAVTACGNL